MPDDFETYSVGLTSPLTTSEIADVSSDDHEFSNTTRSILVTGDGNLIMRFLGDSADLELTVTAGGFYPFRITHIRQATTASVIGFW